MAATPTTASPRPGDAGAGTRARRQPGVRLSDRTAGDGAVGTVTIHDTAGNRHAVSAAAIATEVCVAVMGSNAALADWLSVARSQPGRWLAGTELPSPRSERLVLDLAYVIERARQAWGRESALRAWLSGNDALLDDAPPLEVVRRGDTGIVLKAIDAHLAGSYA